MYVCVCACGCVCVCSEGVVQPAVLDEVVNVVREQVKPLFDVCSPKLFELLIKTVCVRVCVCG